MSQRSTLVAVGTAHLPGPRGLLQLLKDAGFFSVSHSVVGKTLEYVKNQGIHHKKMSFQDEYQKFLESYGVEYNKEYVFKD